METTVSVSGIGIVADDVLDPRIGVLVVQGEDELDARGSVVASGKSPGGTEASKTTVGLAGASIGQGLGQVVEEPRRARRNPSRPSFGPSTPAGVHEVIAVDQPPHRLDHPIQSRVRDLP